MKKLSSKVRCRDVLRSIEHRRPLRSRQKRRRLGALRSLFKSDSLWLDSLKAQGVIFERDRRNRIQLWLPEVMNLSDFYEETVRHINAIRHLVDVGYGRGLHRIHLEGVHFDKLCRISTSAALVLTAELSRWQEVLGRKLKPRTTNWQPEIFGRLDELGFFDLFEHSRLIRPDASQKTRLKIVRYIKGSPRNKEHGLKGKLVEAVGGNRIRKWPLLHTGLDEAITNVGHHAYPESQFSSDKEKSWFLTGAYDPVEGELKVIFYDQGVGIPKTLPASKHYERIVKFLGDLPYSPSFAKGYSDEQLLKASIDMSRSSTGKSDRGKGLGDLLEFIKTRGQGYLSVLSRQGMYKFSIEDGKEVIKSARFENPINGTLIIWKVSLEN